MNCTILTPPGGGQLAAMASKSRAHRLLICAALSDAPSYVRCSARSEDILATVRCLTALGAAISDDGAGFAVAPLRRDAIPAHPVLDPGESGSTLRFLIPVVCALGASVDFKLGGRLPERPLSPLYEELTAHGAVLGPQGSNPFAVAGPLTGNDFTIAASVSSQFISGLLFALPLMGGGSVTLTGQIESAAYLDMTVEALSASGVDVRYENRTYTVRGHYHAPALVTVEGDWSNAAFWLCAGALSPRTVTLTGLNLSSAQGDRAVLDALRGYGAGVAQWGTTVTIAPHPLHAQTIDAAQIPDLVPVLAVVAAVAEGETVICHAERLRLKESDRLQTTAALIRALGGQAEETADGLRITGVRRLRGGTVNAAGDHRIAMAAAVAAIACDGPVTIRGAEAVRKSYPDFFADYAVLGGVVREE